MVALASASFERLKADIIFSSHCSFFVFPQEGLEKRLHDAIVKIYHANELLESLNCRWPGKLPDGCYLGR